MNYHPFVIPFTAGLIFLFIVLLFLFGKWIYGLDKLDKGNILKNLFSWRTMDAIKEVFVESLLHRKIFLKNPLLGYMHMSLAFGWFLLIVFGHVQTILSTGTGIHPPYFPIFFNFFETLPREYPLKETMGFLMDLFLLFVLSGLLIAISKRFYSRMVGMKKTTHLKLFDRLALSSLWFIFPFRFLAESATSGIYNNGDFITGSFGKLLSTFFILDRIEIPLWWAYSFSLGLFFVALPFSRYMHIPTEVVLIFLRKYGIRTKHKYNSFSEIDVHACSRCGLCLDTCQINTSLGKNKMQSVYFLRAIREGTLDNEKLFTCMLCGRCESVCPVGIQLSDIRITQRLENGPSNTSNYNFLTPPDYKIADVVYFAGCMTHLTPSIKKSMLKIFDIAGVNYYFMDSDKEACCGRPLIQSGQYDVANKLIEYNKSLIKKSKAKVLVTSCPICYRTFKEDYKLNIHVMHHTEYILKLVEVGILLINRQDIKMVYHDPCELGRGLNIFEQPRTLLSKVGRLIPVQNEKEDALCCGGSLGSFNLSNKQREKIRDDALHVLTLKNPDKVITSCPLCKKTFSKGTRVEIRDIAEVIASAAVSSHSKIHQPEMIEEKMSS
ncbi:MAG: (Fe-S)-binding protein [Bacteroidales bacterium]|nr:(Fe-S)-binding protein [Bacteroidales bacterium]